MMERQEVDLYRAYLMGKINALNGIKVSERASYNQKRWARRRMNVYFECLAKYNEINNREAKDD